MDKNAQSYYNAVAQLPQYIAKPLSLVCEQTAKTVTEVRLRNNRPVVLSTTNGSFFIDKSGKGSRHLSISAFCTSHDDIEECFKAACAYSVHTYEHYILNGFVPLGGGHRVGISGTAVCNAHTIEAVKNITSLNIRIARVDIHKCDENITSLIHNMNGGIILAGEPGSGKTTALRSVMRELSDLGKKVAVVDERFEIAPLARTGFAYNIPLNCDIMSGYPKHEAMIQAVRSLSPDVILCDEIGNFEDVHAVKQAANAGVKLFITMHGRDTASLRMRPQARAIMQTGAFTNIVFLKSGKTPGVVREVVYVSNDI